MAVPKLRFSGFSEDWNEERFGNVFSFLRTNSYSRDQLNYIDGKYKDIHYGDILLNYGATLDLNDSDIPYVNSNVNTKNIVDHDCLTNGDVIIADTAEDYAVGKATEIVKGSNIKAVSGLHTMACRPKVDTYTGYIGYYLNSVAFQKQTHRIAQGTKVISLIKNHIVKTSLKFPSKAEQQKIADFLTLFDKRIAAQQAIIDDLEKIKKGLLQKIFSREIRFKDENGQEFPEWQEKRLGEVCDNFKSGKTITSTNIYTEGKYCVYGGNGIRGYCDEYNHDGDYVLIGRQGALCGNINFVEGKNYISEHAIAVSGNELATTKWLMYKLYSMNLNRYSESSAQPGLSVEKLVRLKILIPSIKEQNKIEQLFSEVDAKIESEKKVLADLHEIKKGLLQQMFV